MAYTPKTGAKCGCKRGVQRDNCPNCEGTGYAIDFAAIRAANRAKEDAEHISGAMKQGKAQLDSIKEMVEALALANEDGNDTVREAAEQRIHEDALSVEVRSGWYSYGDVPGRPEEYRVLLCTGGPAVQIVGRLNEHCEPETAEMQVQDWGTPWTTMKTKHADREAMLAYARCFYFGDS